MFQYFKERFKKPPLLTPDSFRGGTLLNLWLGFGVTSVIPMTQTYKTKAQPRKIAPAILLKGMLNNIPPQYVLTQFLYFKAADFLAIMEECSPVFFPALK